jgi:large subunit ribosomal protein L30
MARSASQTGKGKLRIQWFRSAIAAPEKHKRVVKGLGFTRLNQIVEREDSPAIRGMVNKIPHLVRVVE